VRFPLLFTTGRILSRYDVGTQTRRTDDVMSRQEKRARSGDNGGRRNMSGRRFG
jgi:predicted molibdopterin-dependent oxidoreductase YjgC